MNPENTGFMGPRVNSYIDVVFEWLKWFVSCSGFALRLFWSYAYVYSGGIRVTLWKLFYVRVFMWELLIIYRSLNFYMWQLLWFVGTGFVNITFYKWIPVVNDTWNYQWFMNVQSVAYIAVRYIFICDCAPVMCAAHS